MVNYWRVLTYHFYNFAHISFFWYFAGSWCRPWRFPCKDSWCCRRGNIVFLICDNWPRGNIVFLICDNWPRLCIFAVFGWWRLVDCPLTTMDYWWTNYEEPMLHHDVFIDFIYSLYLLPCTNVITTIHFFL